MIITADQIRVSPLAELERMFALPVPAVAPRGVYVGEFLTYVESPGARKRWVRAIDDLAFGRTRFGVDFDASAWWFFRPSLLAGHFALSTGRSRWRDTDVLRLRYNRSYLPGFLKHRLYDEVKPFSDGTVLGLGGLNYERGEGDHFFFLLTPLRAPW